MNILNTSLTKFRNNKATICSDNKAIYWVKSQRQDTQHNDTQHNDIQHNDTQHNNK